MGRWFFCGTPWRCQRARSLAFAPRDIFARDAHGAKDGKNIATVTKRRQDRQLTVTSTESIGFVYFPKVNVSDCLRRECPHFAPWRLRRHRDKIRADESEKESTFERTCGYT